MIHFNPRTTRGATGIQQRHLPPHQISIHAPHGARPDIDLDKRLIHVFQSMHHTGCDATFGIPASASANFNPRATRGATINASPNSAFICISIHAPHGVRPGRKEAFLWRQNFNPRATRGATAFAHGARRCGDISIHAPHGVRLSIKCDSVTNR